MENEEEKFQQIKKYAEEEGRELSLGEISSRFGIEEEEILNILLPRSKSVTISEEGERISWEEITF